MYAHFIWIVFNFIFKIEIFLINHIDTNQIHKKKKSMESSYFRSKITFFLEKYSMRFGYLSESNSELA